MRAALAAAVWLGAAVLVGWLAGRFIRVGMVDVQRDDQQRDPA